MGKSTFIKFYAIKKLDYCWSYFVFGWQCSQVFNIVYACYSADVKYRNIYEDPVFVFGPNYRKCLAKRQLHLFTTARESGETLRLGGDGRCCSPGHTAKFLSCTLMDLKTNKILDTQLVQKNEVKNSYAMELEGLQRGLAKIAEEELQVSHLVTDRHSQIKKVHA